MSRKSKADAFVVTTEDGSYDIVEADVLERYAIKAEIDRMDYNQGMADARRHGRTEGLEEGEKIGIINKSDVKDTVRIKVKKAYPAYFGTYNEFHKVREYLDGIDNLYCIGRNGMHRYNNMDHSMLTAIETVNCIKDTSLSKARIWDVNTEQEYHEEK